MGLTQRLVNSALSCGVRPISVVQTGVKSAGWLKKKAHPSPIQSWKETGPMVVSAVKSGTMSPKSSVMSVVLSLCLDDPYWDSARKFSDKITKLAKNLHYE
jgi:hypothetical protein